MRGPAPSIVCPRCALAAPPSDTIQKFTTCTGCGLSFDAAPRERQVARKRPPTTEPAEAVPKRKPGALSALQIVGALLAVFAAGTIWYECSPRNRARRERLDQLHQQTEDEHRRRMDRLESLRMPVIKTGLASCDTLNAQIASAHGCASDEVGAELKKEIGQALLTMGTAKSADVGCAAALAWIETSRARLGCK